MAEHPPVFDTDDAIVERVRALCMTYPDAVEIETWGHPTFRADKKIFVGINGDDKRNYWVVIKTDPDDAPALSQDARFFRAPYTGDTSRWLAMDISGPDLDWGFLAELIDASYRQVALVRQVKELDSRGRTLGK